MPLPSDEQILKTSLDLVNQLQTVFGKHPGFRPGCARIINPTRNLLADKHKTQLTLAA